MKNIIERAKKALFNALKKDPHLYLILCRRTYPEAKMLWIDTQDDVHILRVFTSQSGAQAYLDFLQDYVSTELDDSFFDQYSFKVACTKFSTLLNALNQTYPMHKAAKWEERLECVLCMEDENGVLQEVDVLWQQMPN